MQCFLTYNHSRRNNISVKNTIIININSLIQWLFYRHPNVFALEQHWDYVIWKWHPLISWFTMRLKVPRNNGIKITNPYCRGKGISSCSVGLFHSYFLKQNIRNRCWGNMLVEQEIDMQIYLISKLQMWGLNISNFLTHQKPNITSYWCLVICILALYCY